ncbi:hypothetical protein ACFQHO_11095 [Actinomadura yumaensis]
MTVAQLGVLLGQIKDGQR